MSGARSVLARLLFVAVAATGALTTPARADELPAPVLTAPAVGASVDDNPTFTWQGVPRASKYHIQVSANESFTGTLPLNVDAFATSATPITELPLGTLYWRVASYDGSTAGQYSEAQSFQRVQAAAPVINGPADSNVFSYPDPAVLSWGSVTGMKEYRVQVDDDPTFLTPTLDSTTASTSFALQTALPSNTARYWRVQGISTVAGVTTAWSDAANLRSFTIAWPGATAPTPLTPASSATTDLDDPTFTWSPVAGAVKYEFQISTVAEFPDAVTKSIVTGATRYRAVNALDADQYFWRVRALARNGSASGWNPSDWSPVRRLKTAWLGTDGLLARPVVSFADADPLVAGNQLEQNRIAISWDSLPHATYYQLDISTSAAFPNANPTPTTTTHRRCTTPNTQWTPYLSGIYEGSDEGDFGACSFSGTSTSATSTKFIAPGTQYYVRVRAVDRTPDGHTYFSKWSNEARPGETPPTTDSFNTIAPQHPELATDASQPAQPVDSPSGDGTPLLTWKPVAGAAAYRVMLALDGDMTSRVLEDDYIITPNTQLVVNQVLDDNAAGESYHWIVTPCSSWTDATHYVCDVGDAQAINQPLYTTFFAKEGKPVANPQGGATQQDTLAFSWDEQRNTSPAGGGVSWYQFETRNGADAVVESIKTDSKGYTPVDKGYPDGQYTWRVRAIDASGTALAWSSTSSFTKTSSIPTPQTTVSNGRLPLLKWSPTAYAGSYNVELYTGTDPSFPTGNKVTGTTAWSDNRQYTAATPKDPLPAGTYSWRVQQVDPYGNKGPWSTAVNPFTIGGTAPALSAPANGASVEVPSLVFDWADVPGAVRYKLETSTSAAFSTLAQSITTTDSTYAPTVAYNGGTTYYWRVTPLNGNGDALATPETRSFTALTAPAAPAAPTAGTVGAALTISWLPPATGGSALTGYVVRYRAVGAATWTELERAADVNSVALTGLVASQSYEAQVAARNAVGLSQFSAKVTKAAPAVPKVPTNLKLTAADRGFSVTWTAPSTTSNDPPITGYFVRWTPTAGGTPTEKAVTETNTTLTGLDDATGYTVEVAAVSDMGRGAFASTTGTTGNAPAIPDTAFTSGPANNASVNTASPSFGFAGVPAASAVSFECSVDGEAFQVCGSPQNLSGLSEGTHTFAVRSVDSRNRRDASPAQRSFTVDLTAPDTRIDASPTDGATATTAAFTYAGTPAADAARFECRLDDAAFASCPTAGKTYAGLAVGAHTFAVRAIDAAGNPDPTPASYGWSITAPPAVSPVPTQTAGPDSTQTPVTTASPTPSPAPSATPAPTVKARCKVPNVKGKTRTAAKKALYKANCGLGSVKGPKTGKVKSQSVKAGKTGAFGMKVSLKLAKPKAKRKR